MGSYGIPIFENLSLTDSIGESRGTILSETLSLSDGEIYLTDKDLSDALSLDDTYSRVWLATPEFSETLSLTDTPTWEWEVAKIYTETISLTDSVTTAVNRTLVEVMVLTDGDDTESVIVSPNGGYISVLSEESTASAALAEATKLLEEQGAPRSQTQWVMAYNSDLDVYTVAAIVKRH